MRANWRPFSAAVVSQVTVVMVLALGWQAHAQEAKTLYPKMAPLEQYLMERDAEIKLARSAAPDSVSKDAAVMVLGRHGYETAVQGKNEFVCAVVRSWAASYDDPEFWNPKVRSPICFNQAAARSYFPRVLRKTDLLLAGKSKTQVSEEVLAALDKKELPAIEIGSMCYMMSKDGHLSDRDGHWHSHLMFFVPLVKAESWGANLPESPVLAGENAQEKVTVFLIPVARWSDGSAAPAMEHD